MTRTYSKTSTTGVFEVFQFTQFPGSVALHRGVPSLLLNHASPEAPKVIVSTEIWLILVILCALTVALGAFAIVLTLQLRKTTQRSRHTKQVFNEKMNKIPEQITSPGHRSLPASENRVSDAPSATMHANAKFGANDTERLIGLLPAVAWTLNEDLQITSALGRIESFLETNIDNCVGSHLSEVLSRVSDGFLSVATHKAALTGESRTGVFIHRGRPFHGSITPLVPNGYDYTGVLTVVIDGAAMAHLDETSPRLRAILDQREHEMERLIHTVSHDLKTPLVSLSGFSEYVTRDLQSGRTDRIPDFVEEIRGAVADMARLTDELLAYGRIGQSSPQLEVIDLGKLVDEIGNSNPGIFNRESLHLNPNAIELHVIADRELLQLALWHLFHNATTHGHGEPNTQITVQASLSDGYIRIEVEDNGKGIAEKHRERVFELFSQLNPNSTGAGMGLAIVRRIARCHGGDAGVAPGEGGGCKAWVTLPHRVTHREDRAPRSELSAEENA